MRTLKFLFVCLSVILTGCAGIAGAPNYKVGATFRDVYNIGLSQIPLPEGEWKLIWYYKEFVNQYPFHYALLIQTREGKLSKVVEAISPGRQHTAGYSPSRFCERTDIIYMQKRANFSGGKQDCWGINHIEMTLEDDWNQVYESQDRALRAEGIELPENMLIVNYYKGGHGKILEVYYGFNPELEGFPPPTNPSWSHSHWHKSRYMRDNKKIKYINRLKKWGTAWDSKINDGFAGRLSVGKSSADELSAKLEQLQQLVDDGVITRDDYDRKKQELLDALE